MLEALEHAGVEFLVVGAHALAAHGLPRATGDFDIWIRPTSANAARLISALHAFGAPIAAHGVTESDFATENTVYQLGVPPRRIDLLTSISGVAFDEAWASKLTVTMNGLRFYVLGRDPLLKNKRAAGRPKDIADVIALESAGEPDEG